MIFHTTQHVQNQHASKSINIPNHEIKQEDISWIPTPDMHSLIGNTLKPKIRSPLLNLEPEFSKDEGEKMVFFILHSSSRCSTPISPKIFPYM